MPETGDVDGDGEINIKDVTSLIDLLINIDEEEVGMPPYADADDDGEVSVGDITRLIDNVLTAR
jgi:hypothetical protein